MNFFLAILERLRQGQISISAKVSLLFAVTVLGLSSLLYFFFLDYEIARNSEAFDKRAQLLLDQMVAAVQINSLWMDGRTNACMHACMEIVFLIQ